MAVAVPALQRRAGLTLPLLPACSPAPSRKTPHLPLLCLQRRTNSDCALDPGTAGAAGDQGHQRFLSLALATGYSPKGGTPQRVPLITDAGPCAPCVEAEGRGESAASASPEAEAPTSFLLPEPLRPMALLTSVLQGRPTGAGFCLFLPPSLRNPHSSPQHSRLPENFPRLPPHLHVSLGLRHTLPHPVTESGKLKSAVCACGLCFVDRSNNRHCKGLTVESGNAGIGCVGSTPRLRPLLTWEEALNSETQFSLPEMRRKNTPYLLMLGVHVMIKIRPASK